MSERALKGLVGALVIVGLMWGVASLLGGGRGGSSSAPSGGLAEFFLDLEETSTVRMEGPTGLVELSWTGDAWMANGAPADAEVIASFWQALSASSIGDRVATNPSNHARMGVSPDSAWALRITQGEDVREILIGNDGSRYGTAFVRLPQEDDVFVFSGGIRAYVTRSVDQWRDKRVVAVDTSAVQRIEIERGGGVYSLVRAEGAWTFAGGGAVDAAAVSGVLEELAGFLAAGFLTPSDSIYGLPEEAAIRAFDDSGAILAQVSISEGAGDRWAQAEGSTNRLRVPLFRADRLTPPRVRMVPPG